MRNCYQFVSFSRLTNFLWTLLIVVLCNCSPKFGCPLEEYEALLKLRSSLLHYNNSSLPTWGRGRDCCLWERVSCNNSTQHVSKLMLSSLVGYDQLQDWRLNFSIFSSFHKLQQLDLSSNQIGGSLSQIDISGLRKLELLDLSFNGLTGTIPLSFKNLSSLHVLKLEGNMLHDALNGEGLLGLHKLRLLNLGENQLIGGIPIALGNLSSLNFLYLFQNNLTGSVPSQVLGRLQNLRMLDLLDNQLNGSLPLSLKKLVSLQYLDLSLNNMKGNIPPRIVESLDSLKLLDLSHNQFDDNFSFSSFGNLSKLEFIDLSNNEELFIHLDSGKFVPSFQLRYLFLSHCNLDANPLATPAFLASQCRLKALDLSHTNLTGNFPHWLFENLTRLEVLNLRNNSIMGAFQLPKHLNMSIYALDLSMNLLSGPIPTDIGTIFPHTASLNMSSNYLTGNIPSSLGNMSTDLSHLDLSNNFLSGEVPNFLMMIDLDVLKLSNNSLHGKMFDTNDGYTSPSCIFLDGNKFTGTLPTNQSFYLELSVLDVHNNQLSGIIPEGIGNAYYLAHLSLEGNHFHGPIPDHLCNLTNLQVLDLSRNNLSGSLPHCFQSSKLVYIKFAGNALTGTIPNSYLNISHLAALDVSHNQLSGKLPRPIGDQISLEILVLSENSLGGPIPMELCKLQSLHILDLSQNNLSGSIPSCIGKMHFRKPNSALAVLSYVGSSLGYPDSWDVQTVALAYIDEIMMVDLISKGNLYAYRTDHLPLMSAIDFSANKLTENIPPEIGEI